MPSRRRTTRAACASKYCPSQAENSVRNAEIGLRGTFWLSALSNCHFGGHSSGRSWMNRQTGPLRSRHALSIACRASLSLNLPARSNASASVSLSLSNDPRPNSRSASTRSASASWKATVRPHRTRPTPNRTSLLRDPKHLTPPMSGPLAATRGCLLSAGSASIFPKA